MIIAAFKNGETRTYTKNVHQFDKGQKLIVTGIALPESYEVHISNNKDGGMAVAYEGNIEGVYIPDAFFVSGDYIYVWLYTTATHSEGSGSYGYQMGPDNEELEEVTVGGKVIEEGETAYEIIIPVVRRPINVPVADKSSGGAMGYIVDENETLIPVIK